MQLNKKSASIFTTIFTFFLGLVTVLTKKSSPKPHASMVLTVGKTQIEKMLVDGGSVLFEGVNVNGHVRLQIVE